MSAHDQIQLLHAAYCAETGYEIRFTMDFEHAWFDIHRQGFTAEDVRLVINYLRKLYFKRPDILVPSIRLHRLIGDTMRFSEFAAEARKIVRTKKENASKSSVLRTTGRSTEEIKEAVPVANILASEAFREMVKLKETLK
jgi:hypothetical protein